MDNTGDKYDHETVEDAERESQADGAERRSTAVDLEDLVPSSVLELSVV